jgi:hypothetical protein
MSEIVSAPPEICKSSHPKYVEFALDQLGNVHDANDGWMSQHVPPYSVSGGYSTRFPVQVFPKYVQDFIGGVQVAVGCSEEIVIAPCLVAIARSVAEWELEEMTHVGRQRANIYAATVADAGDGKGPAASYVLEESYAHNSKLRASHKPEPGVLPPCAVVGNTTVEALYRVMVAAEKTPGVGGILVHADELKSLTSGMNQFKNGRGNDRQFFLSAWDGKELPPCIRANGTYLCVRRPSLSILGNIPPDQLRYLEDKEDRGDGFLPRFLFHIGPDWSPRPVTSFEDGIFPDADPSKVAWRKALRRLHDVTDPVQLQLSPDAKQAWVDGLNGHTELRVKYGFTGGMKSVWSKYRVQAARLAIILHAMSVAGEDGSNFHETLVSAETIRNAWLLSTYYLDTARRIFEKICSSRCSSESVDVAEQVLKKIHHHGLTGPEGFTSSHLHQKVRNTKGLGSADTVHAALDQLYKQGKMEKIDKKYRLIPASGG